MVRGDVADDREPEPRAAGVAAAGLVDPVEALEDAVDVASGNPDPLVGDHDLDRRLGDASKRTWTTPSSLLYLTAFSTRLPTADVSWPRSPSDADRRLRFDRHHLDAAALVGDPTAADRGLHDGRRCR